MGMVDPVEIVIGWLRADADLALLVGGRIAVKHKYGMPDESSGPWPRSLAGLTVTPTAGATPLRDNCRPARAARMDLIAYAPTPEAAEPVIRRVLALADTFDRTAVPLADGTVGLLLMVDPDDSPAADREPDLALDMLRVPINVMTAGAAVE